MDQEKDGGNLGEKLTSSTKMRTELGKKRKLNKITNWKREEETDGG